MLSGVILVNKPGGIISFRVVSIIKKIFNTKKVGHAGTLDPLATGLLPILINKATKIQGLIQNADKEYIAKFKLGITTDTEDITGAITSKYKDDFSVSEEELKNVLIRFTGDLKQVPPMYSAISKDGIRLYSLARKGVEIEREPRNVKINRLELLEFNPSSKTAKILVSCSKGTYVRTLCADIGKSLGYGGVLISLKRTKTCNFNIGQSITLEKLEELKKIGKEHTAVIPLENIFGSYESVLLNEAHEKMFKNGMSFEISPNENITTKKETSILKVFNANKLFLGLGKFISETKMLYFYKLLV